MERISRSALVGSLASGTKRRADSGTDHNDRTGDFDETVTSYFETRRCACGYAWPKRLSAGLRVESTARRNGTAHLYGKYAYICG